MQNTLINLLIDWSQRGLSIAEFKQFKFFCQGWTIENSPLPLSTRCCISLNSLPFGLPCWWSMTEMKFAYFPLCTLNYARRGEASARIDRNINIISQATERQVCEIQFPSSTCLIMRWCVKGDGQTEGAWPGLAPRFLWASETIEQPKVKFVWLFAAESRL